MPTVVPFDSDRWSWGAPNHASVEHLGRRSVRLGGAPGGWIATLGDVELLDGTIEIELAVGPERGFHGVVWRSVDDENLESFYVRPHQVGNPDSIQYNPVFNDQSTWQLYHGEGFWAPVEFPLDEWFRIRVAFAGERAEVFVGDLGEPVLRIGQLKRTPAPGRVGILVGGNELHVAEFAYDEAVSLGEAAPPMPPPVDGAISAWDVSDPFREDELSDTLDLSRRSWTRLESEPSGLVDLARANGIRDGRNTVFARTTIRSSRAQAVPLEVGFSDRALVFLNGRPLYRGDDSYRSRDYRFLGSIGYWDTLYLPLAEGENELVVAVAEDFGGWGVQARFPGGAPSPT